MFVSKKGFTLIYFLLLIGIIRILTLFHLRQKVIQSIHYIYWSSILNNLSGLNRHWKTSKVRKHGIIKIIITWPMNINSLRGPIMMILWFSHNYFKLIFTSRGNGRILCFLWFEKIFTGFSLLLFRKYIKSFRPFVFFGGNWLLITTTCHVIRYRRFWNLRLIIRHVWFLWCLII